MIDYTGIPNELNERIRFIRNKNEKKQREIAEILNIDRATYAKYESGNRTIPVEAIIGLSDIYSLSTDFILGTSAKPQYVDYSNYNTKLSPQATTFLQSLPNGFNNCLSGFNALLESRYACRIFYYLGLMLKFPNNYYDLLMNSEDDVQKYGALLAYGEDFTNPLNVPVGMFGIEDKDLRVMEDVYAPDVFETYFYTFLAKFINEVRESPETKKAFFGELKRAYYKYVKEDIPDMEEYYANLTEGQEFDNKTE